MLIPKQKIETVELMYEEIYLGDISYDLVNEIYSFKRNEKVEDLSVYPAEFYGLFNRKLREIPSDVIREFIVDRIIPYNRIRFLKNFLVGLVKYY